MKDKKRVVNIYAKSRRDGNDMGYGVIMQRGRNVGCQPAQVQRGYYVLHGICGPCMSVQLLYASAVELDSLLHGLRPSM